MSSNCSAAPDLSLDAVYTHDASLPTDHGLIVMRPGKPNRVTEGPHHALVLQLSISPRSAPSPLPAPPKPETSSGLTLKLFSSATATAPTPQAFSKCAPCSQPQA